MDEDFEPVVRDVLIIDDAPEVRGVMVRTFTQAGYTVDAADDGMAALDLLGQQRYRAIVCDLKLPFLTGQEFYDQLRHVAPDQSERIVFVTGSTEVEARRFLARSKRPVLTKPYQLKDLLSLVADLVGRPPNAGTAL